MKYLILMGLVIGQLAFSSSVTSPGVNCSAGAAGQVYTTNGSACSFTTVAGTGDVVGPSSAVDAEIALFNGTTGKAIKRATGTGLCKATSGVASFATLVNADVSTSAAIAVAKLAALTASRALVSDGSGVVSPATTTATEIGYVNGVTSAIQTQMDTKLPTTGVGLVEQFTGFIEAGSDKAYTLDAYASYAYTINTLKVKTSSGTATVAVKINGTSVTGISAVSASSTIATGTASAANSVAIGDKVTYVLSSSSSPVDMEFTLKYTR